MLRDPTKFDRCSPTYFGQAPELYGGAPEVIASSTAYRIKGGTSSMAVKKIRWPYTEQHAAATIVVWDHLRIA
jgi:hypothetical protein